MADVNFDEASDLPQSVGMSGTRAGITGFLIKNGIAKDTQGANTILVVITIVALGVAAFAWMAGQQSEYTLTDAAKRKLEASTQY